MLEMVGANVEDGQNVLVCGDFSACWCGKAGIGGGCFIASLCLDLSRWGLRRSFAATVSTVPGRWHVTGYATGAATGGATGAATGGAMSGSA